VLTACIGRLRPYLTLAAVLAISPGASATDGVINDALTTPQTLSKVTTMTPTDDPAQPGGAKEYVGVFRFTARFCNNGTKGDQAELGSLTTVMTNNNALLNRDNPTNPGAPRGVGSARTFALTGQYSDGVLGGKPPASATNECVDVPYEVGLTNRNRFQFNIAAFSKDAYRQAVGIQARVDVASSVLEGTTVPLQAVVTGVASGSETCTWTPPPGVTVTPDANDLSGCTASFVAPSPLTSPQTLDFQVAIADGTASGSATGSTTVQPDAIWVDAGKSRGAAAGQTIHLGARGAGSGPGPDVYTWTQLSPADALVTLANAGTDNPSFVVPTVDQPRTLVFEVTFTDGLKTATDTVAIGVDPTPTVAPNTPLTLPGATQRQPLVVVVQPAAEVPAGSVQQLSAVASGGDGHYTWNWKTPISSSSNSACQTTEGPDNAQIFEVTLPGACPEQNVTYKIGVIVTDGSGQQAEQDTDLWVNVPSGLPLNVYAPTVATSEGPLPVTIGASATGGTDPYTYSWTQTGGPTVTLTNPDTAQPSFVPPAVDADTTLTFEVTATDSTSATTTREMNVLVRNAFALTPPQRLTLQVPGPVQLLAGDSIALPATASGGTGPYTWQWQQTAGTAATLTGATTDTVSVTPASGPDTLTLQVTVTDSAGTPVVKQATVQVDVLGAPSGAPLSVPAIPKQYVDEGLANLGILATPQGGTGPYSYSWEFIPSGGLASLPLTDATTSIVRFDAPQVSAQSMLQFRVTVTDHLGASATRDAYVVVKDITPPLELTLASQTLSAAAGQTVSLSVGAPRGGTGPYTYAWTQTGGSPAVTLTGANTPAPTFTAPSSATANRLTFTLTVTDANGSSQTATQSVDIAPVVTGPVVVVEFDSNNPTTVNESSSKAFAIRTDKTLASNMEVGFALSGVAVAGTNYKLYDDQKEITTAGKVTLLAGKTRNPYKVTGIDDGVIGTDKNLIITLLPGAGYTLGNTSTWTMAVKDYVAKPGSWCLLCGDEATKTPCNDLDLVLGEPQKCPDDKPYCMNDVIQRGTDIKEYRRCIQEGNYGPNDPGNPTPGRLYQGCDELWYRATSDEPLCLPFDHNSAEASLNCHICCYGDPAVWNPSNPDQSKAACNLDTNPPRDTLYRP